MPVNYVIIAVLHRGGVHHDRIRAGHIDFCHCKTAADIPRNEGSKKFIHLFLIAVFMKNFNITGIRRLTSEYQVSQR